MDHKVPKGGNMDYIIFYTPTGAWHSVDDQ